MRGSSPRLTKEDMSNDHTRSGKPEKPPFRGKPFRGKKLKTSLPRPAPPAAPPPQRKSAERVAKVIARAGLCSRRDAEAWIAAGRVSVNSAVITSPALNVRETDKIVVDGQPLPQRERTRLFLYYKPRGLVTTNSDPEGRPTIFGALPKNLPRLISVGRLDLNMAASRRPRSMRCAAAWRSRASAMAPSRPRSTASRAPISGSLSPSAKARTAKCATCWSISGCR
jgi:23S rRNA pseudouridine2605 synthase